MASKSTIEALHSLDRDSCQNLLEYASSRARSMALTFVTSHKWFSDNERTAYLTSFANELLVAVYILGYAVVVHNDQITVPWALRKLVRSLTQERLGDVSVLLQTAGDHASQTDSLLEFYASDWWSTFSAKSPVPDISAPRLIQLWRSQRRNLVTLGRRNVLDLTNLSAFSRDELIHARRVADDALSELELESEKAIVHLGQVEECIIDTGIVAENLKGLVEKYTLEKRDDLVSQERT